MTNPQKCRYGKSCYRKNKEHFIEYYHEHVMNVNNELVCHMGHKVYLHANSGHEKPVYICPTCSNR
jgi:hypothetical protein